MDVDLSEESAGESEDVLERLVSEGSGHLTVRRDGSHGVRQVHLHHKVVQDLNTHHTVVHRTLHTTTPTYKHTQDSNYYRIYSFTDLQHCGDGLFLTIPDKHFFIL